MSLLQIATGLVIGGTGAVLYAIRPRDPVFEVLSIDLKGFKLGFNTDSFIPVPVIDVELSISVKVTNPNVAPIEYSCATMCIYYRDSLIGQAQANGWIGGKQHLKDLAKDVKKREMCLKSVVSIKGVAKVWKWGHKFEVDVESLIKVDPIFMDVIDQENKAHLQLHPEAVLV
nr:late embryogenesis abundant protein LEA59 [Pinus tabuliformis]